MVFTATQKNAFFTEADQLAITLDMRAQLATEVLETVDDLAEFYDKSLKQITDTLRRPGGRIPDPNPGSATGATIPTPSFVFNAKSQLRLKAAIMIAKYYNTVGRTPSAGKFWSPVIKTFIEYWKALKAHKNNTDPKVPKISKTLSIMKWTEALSDFARWIVGSRTIPFSYVIRDTMIYESMDRSIDVLTDGSIDVLIDGSIDWSIDWSIDGLMDDSINGLIDVSMDGWMDRSMHWSIDG